MTQYAKHAARIVGGILLVLIGIVGLALPIMPGWALIIPGLILLADYCPPIRRLLNWAEGKLEERNIRWRK
jgi:uncharacterized membrane protein YbaN (DUF454 family)